MNSFLLNFPAEIQERLRREALRKDYKRGDLVYRVGDTPAGVYFVESGLVGLTMVGSSSGKEHLLRFFKGDQFFGHRALFSGEGYHGTATVLEASTISLIPKAPLLAALEQHPILFKEILTIVAKELRRCEEQHVMILENQILPRIALAVIYLKDLHPDHNWTRQEIANFCASTVSTVIKALSELEEKGLIQQTGRAIEILDRDALLALQEA